MTDYRRNQSCFEHIKFKVNNFKLSTLLKASERYLGEIVGENWKTSLAIVDHMCSMNHTVYPKEPVLPNILGVPHLLLRGVSGGYYIVYSVKYR